ncbi:DUF3500 domain-containing protein [Thalassoroseus pseudoceratinae]|uniref:DUF3500 domain-containing protein n=1 Tax=Thalassoroseus pseudoceratinae TaxID=2713176 RepID=UPI00141FCF69|nr:DUF3500 domain-containing protein [Thalassoroseus pseudoceratinae]
MTSETPRVNIETPRTEDVSRRRFVQTVGAGIGAAGVSRLSFANEKPAGKTPAKEPKSEQLVRKLYDSLDERQRKQIAFPWDHKKDGVPHRLHVRANWQITKPKVNSDFFTADQQDMIEAIFWGLYNPEWHPQIKKQLRDDAGGYGKSQSIALFGEPDSGKFEFVMTGRHLTIRCDGDSTDHFAFGGPIFYGHAAQSFTEKPDHPGNVFWPQALQANKLYEMLEDGKQRKQALVKTSPSEDDVHFEGAKGDFDGIAIRDLSSDQKEHVQKVLKTLIEPYRNSDQTEVMKCLKAQGGLDECHIAFYESDDVGEDEVWDTWRLEGPSFVWHFRGDPHVHVWVNVADDPSTKVSTG